MRTPAQRYNQRHTIVSVKNIRECVLVISTHRKRPSIIGVQLKVGFILDKFVLLLQNAYGKIPGQPTKVRRNLAFDELFFCRRDWQMYWLRACYNIVALHKYMRPTRCDMSIIKLTTFGVIWSAAEENIIALRNHVQHHLTNQSCVKLYAHLPQPVKLLLRLHMKSNKTGCYSSTPSGNRLGNVNVGSLVGCDVWMNPITAFDVLIVRL